MTYRSNLMICTAMVGLVATSPARAQQQAAVLEEVTVTARKTEESIMTVPLAVTAISGAQLEERHVIDLLDIAQYTPGYTHQNQAVARNDRYYRQAIIRGVIPGNALATRQAASIFVDGALVFGGNIDNLTDVERVEVIKGPQSAYFGRGTFAGAVNFVTRAPALDKWGAKLDVDVGTWKTANITGTVEGPVVEDKFAVRLTGNHYTTGGQYSDVGWPGYKLGQRSTQDGAFSFIITPNDALKIRGYVSYTYDDDGLPANAEFTDAQWNCNAGAAPTNRFNYICGELGPVPTRSQQWSTEIDAVAFAALFRGNGQPDTASYHGINFPDHMGLTRKQKNGRISAEYELPSGYMINANAAIDRDKKGFLQASQFIDVRNVPNPFYPATPGVKPYNYSLVSGQAEDDDENAEVRITSPQKDRFHWMIGGNFFHDRSHSQTLSYGNAGFALANAHSIFVNHTWGLFGAVSYDVTSQITITGEARHQWEDIWQTTLAGAYPVFENSSTSFTPRVIVEYKPTQDLTIYGSYSEGTRPIEFNTAYFTLTAAQQAEITRQAAVTGLVPADRIKMGEIGVKGLFFGGSLRLLAAGYIGKWTARHIPQTVSYTQANGLLGAIQTTSAGGIVDLSGLEIEGAYKATRELTFEGSFGIAHTKNVYTYSADALILTGNPSPVGTKLPFFPEMQGNLAVTYTRPVFDDFDGFVRVDYFYRGKVYESEANLAWTAPSNKFNLSLGVQKNGYKIELYGKNIFDDRTPTSLARNGVTFYTATGTVASTGSGIAVSLADKASFGIHVSAKF